MSVITRMAGLRTRAAVVAASTAVVAGLGVGVSATPASADVPESPDVSPGPGGTATRP